MENSVLYNTPYILKIIRLLFKITVLFLVLILITFVFLKVDHSVTFSNGNVYSKTPKVKIAAPFNATIQNVYVKEGQEVVKGDTLMILKSQKINTQHETSFIKTNQLEAQIKALQQQLQYAKESQELSKISNQNTTNLANQKTRFLQKELTNFKKRLAVSLQQSKLDKNNYLTDSILYQKGVLSRIEFEKQKNKYFKKRHEQLAMESEYNNKLHQLQQSKQYQAKAQHNLKQTQHKIAQQIMSIEAEIQQFNLLLKEAVKKLDYQHYKKDLLYITAPTSGSVSYLFNTQYQINTVTANTNLLIITPPSEQFYVKANLPEKNLLYITENQEVILKSNVYSYLKFGGIKGRVSYVSPSAIRKEFYCLINIEEEHPKIHLKPDYKVAGNIITGQLRLYEYLFKMLFDKF